MSVTKIDPKTGLVAPVLRRELGVWEALALSVGEMSPALAMSAAGAGAAGIIGRAVPLAFLFASIAVCLVGYGFIYLSRYFAHAGSVYGFTGVTVGPRAGFFSGWALLLCYTVFTPSSLIAFGAFLAVFARDTGLWPHANYITFTLIGGVIVLWGTSRDIKRLTRSLLSIEGLSVTLILILIVVVFVKLLGHSGPGHFGITKSVFVLPSGAGMHTVALAGVFGFLAFAGFEGASSLGEETVNPRKSIPRAITMAVVGASIFFVVCMCMQSWAFGGSAKGAAVFAASPGPLFDIAHSYLTSWVAYALEIGASISALGAALGSSAGGCRLLYALSRDGMPKGPLSRVSARTGAPVNALLVLMTISFAIDIGMAINGAPALSAWGYVGTIGVLALIVAYLMVNIGAARHMYIHRADLKLWRVIVPIAAIVILGYTLYSQIYPVPANPFNIFPYIVASWLVLGFLIVMLAPGLAQRIGVGLAVEEKLVGGEAPDAPVVGPAE